MGVWGYHQKVIKLGLSHARNFPHSYKLFLIRYLYAMRIDIISVVPELMHSPFAGSIMKRAQEAGLAEVHFHNLRDYTTNAYKQVDDYPYGGGAGMVLMVAPIDKCISQLKAKRTYDAVIYLTPDGDILNQGMANALSLDKWPCELIYL